MLNASLTGVGSVLHVASTINPRDSDALAVRFARVHALLEGGGGRNSADVSTAVVVAALDLEVLVHLSVVVVVASTSERRGCWGWGNGTGGGDGAGRGTSTRAGKFGSPDGALSNEVARGALGVASAVFVTVRICQQPLISSIVQDSRNVHALVVSGTQLNAVGE